MNQVAQLLHNRAHSRPDTARLAVIAESGGNRFVLAAGAAARLGCHNIRPQIVGGASGGGLPLLYYAMGQVSQFSLPVVPRVCEPGFALDGRHRLINPWRALQGQPILDVEGLIHQVFTHHLPLNWPGFASLPIPCFLTATHTNGKGVVQRLDGADVATAKAMACNTARIPWVAGKLGQHDLWDGNLSDSLPITPALELRATHVLVLRTMGQNQVPKPSLLEDYVVSPLLKKRAPQLHRLLQARHATKAATVARYAEDPRVLMVSLPHVPIQSGSRKVSQLLPMFLQAWHHLGRVLQLPPMPYPPEWSETLRRFGPR